MDMTNIHLCDTPKLLGLNAAKQVANLAQTVIQQQGHCHLGLCGGQTIQYLFAALIKEPYVSTIPWHQLHIYLADERYVPMDHADSNYQLIKKLLLDHVPIPKAQIHRIETEYTDPKIAANSYMEKLPIALDILILSMGPDGHIASLFPNTDILNTTASAAAVYVEKLESWRVSLTFPTLNKAKNLILLVSGENKADIIYDVLIGNNEEINYPIQMINSQGTVDWYLDKNAAKKLTHHTKPICNIMQNK